MEEYFINYMNRLKKAYDKLDEENKLIQQLYNVFPPDGASAYLCDIAIDVLDQLVNNYTGSNESLVSDFIYRFDWGKDPDTVLIYTDDKSESFTLDSIESLWEIIDHYKIAKGVTKKSVTIEY